jgi:hypothetical protein
MSALNTGGFVAHKINYDPDMVSRDNAKLFGDELWSDVKTMIDNSYTDPRELNNALTYILRGDSGKQYSKDEKKAVELFKQAAEQDNGDAQYQLAKCYLKGTGVAKDEAKAKSWLKKAVKNEKDGKSIRKDIEKDAANGKEDAKRLKELLK